MSPSCVMKTALARVLVRRGSVGVFRVEMAHSCTVNLVGLPVYSVIVVNGAITYAIIREPLYVEVFLPLSSFFSYYKQ